MKEEREGKNKLKGKYGCGRRGRMKCERRESMAGGGEGEEGSRALVYGRGLSGCHARALAWECMGRKRDISVCPFQYAKGCRNA